MRFMRAGGVNASESSSTPATEFSARSRHLLSTASTIWTRCLAFVKIRLACCMRDRHANQQNQRSRKKCHSHRAASFIARCFMGAP
jgi:hypothetical protein